MLNQTFIRSLLYLDQREMSDTEPDSLFTSVTRDSHINLSIGAPGTSLLSQVSPMFSEGCADVMSGDLSLFQYGPEAGTRQYRRELSQFLSSRYQGPVDPEELVLTTGATNGLHLTVSCLVKRGGIVFCENPTYFIALDILKNDLGLEVIPVDIVEGGIDTESLETKIQSAAERRKEEKEKDGRYWGVYYTIPTLHNPTGITFSKAVSVRIVELSRKYNILVICDDVYNLLSYSSKPAPRLKSLDMDGNIISNGTFSKILCPGVRLGWLEAPLKLACKLKQSGILLSSGSQNNLMSGLVTSLLRSGALATNLDSALDIYRERMEAALDCLTQLSSDWKVNNPRGGYFLWVTNCAGVDLDSFCSWLEREKAVTVLRGWKASPFTYLGQSNQTTSCRQSFRLSIAYYEKEYIVKACNTICDAIREYFG